MPLSAAPNPVAEGPTGEGDGDPVVGAVERRDDPADADGGHGRGGRFRCAGGHHGQRRLDDRVGHGAPNQDTDTGDETFTVPLDSRLPLSVAPGAPSQVRVTITDDDGGTGRIPAPRHHPTRA